MPLPPARRHKSRSPRPARSARMIRPLPIRKPWTYVSKSSRHTERLGQCLGQAAQGGDVLALFGDLGTGKTTLVRGLAQGLQAEPAKVSSPTFTLIQEYPGRLRLVHTDLYRLTAGDLQETGLSDYLDDRSVLAIEWPERWAPELPADRLDIRLLHRTADTRHAVLVATGPASTRLLARVRARLARRRPSGGSKQTRVQSRRSRRASQ
jgi:tRNA threonylcarbamoyladenosine biosynthesis protein TsaE